MFDLWKTYAEFAPMPLYIEMAFACLTSEVSAFSLLASYFARFLLMCEVNNTNLTFCNMASETLSHVLLSYISNVPSQHQRIVLIVVPFFLPW